MTPRVSVIVPAHNAETFIADTLRSIQDQTFPDWEAIVADDASADGTAAAARAVADPRIRVLRSDANLGPAGARNLALEQARGELVAFLDADDAWLPTYLERQVRRYDAEPPGVGIVACDARLTTGDRELPGTYLDRLRGRRGDLSLERLLRGNAIYVSALAPRQVIEDVGGLAPELFGTEDHDLWLRILETGRRAVLNDEPLAIYRVSQQSVSGNLARMARNHQRTLQRALQRDRLTPRQRRIARSELRYHRAMELVAEAAHGEAPDLRRIARGLPLLAAVAASHPARWGDWARALRARGRVLA